MTLGGHNSAKVSSGVSRGLGCVAPGGCLVCVSVCVGVCVCGGVLYVCVCVQYVGICSTLWHIFHFCLLLPVLA